MKSLSVFHFTSSLIMMILLLLCIIDPTASSDDSLGALKNERSELTLGTTTKPTGVYEYLDSLLNPVITPKYTVDDAMNKMDAKFTQVKSDGDLMEIMAKWTAQEISAYRELEMAINGALNDMRLGSSIDIQSKAVKLYNQLDEFIQGMLGTANTFPDLLNNVRDFYDCGSKSIEKMIKELMAMANFGTVGLIFYTRAINNKDIFNGEERIKKLSTSYEFIYKRFKNTMKSCASLDKAVIDKYISKVLSVNQEDHVQTADVSKLLYKRFDEIYQPVRPDIVWVFYTAWSYDAVGGPQSAGRNAQSYNMTYNGDGISGVTKNGGWTVFWVGHPLPAPAKLLDVSSSDLRDIIISEQGNLYDNPRYRNAYALQVKMQPSLYSGRVPVFNLVLTNPPRKATIGTPLVGDRINIWQTRIGDVEWYFYYRPFPAHKFWENVIVDFIIF